MNKKLYSRREISAQEALDMSFKDAFEIERKIKEDLLANKR